jgi:hypothetical protein
MKPETTGDNLVPPDLDDVHAKIVEGLDSVRQGKCLDGETVMAEMLAALINGPYASAG